ncbi:conserved hypothetical protein [Hyphomicrobiales bacterium]|nr:conserved hypothetical protein [Hyphomicrobiales bacterium]CAH1701399.1 conserved hypothetical protein [Hyphomicrobiales bacterium]CAI0345357.1 conserved hypothetical protein [Hyphomicrobiales bacterium]
MISYLQAARELDLRWSFSLQFLPPTPTLYSNSEYAEARGIARAEVDLFMRYAKEIAAGNELHLNLLVDLYDLTLVHGLSWNDGSGHAASDRPRAG